MFQEGYCSVAILWILIFCILSFSKFNTYIGMMETFCKRFIYSFMRVLKSKENKKVFTICFEANPFPRKKRKIELEFFYIWIHHFYFGSTQKYLWKRFYSIKKPLSNRAKILCRQLSKHLFVGIDFIRLVPLSLLQSKVKVI